MTDSQLEALKFYADPENYAETVWCGIMMYSPVEIDSGMRARQAIHGFPYGEPLPELKPTEWKHEVRKAH